MSAAKRAARKGATPPSAPVWLRIDGGLVNRDHVARIGMSFTVNRRWRALLFDCSGRILGWNDLPASVQWPGPDDLLAAVGAVGAGATA